MHMLLNATHTYSDTVQHKFKSVKYCDLNTTIKANEKTLVGNRGETKSAKYIK